MPSTTGKHILSYPTEGATSWFATWQVLAQGISSYMDDLSTTIINTVEDVNDNEILTFGSIASAVNEFTIINAATGNDPVLSVTGSDTNIDMTLTIKGTGITTFSGTEALLVPVGTTAQQPSAPSAGYLRYNTTESKLEYYNSSAWAVLEASVANFIGDSDFSTNGLMTRTGAGTYTNRSVAVNDAQLTIADGDGAAGNPTIDFGAVALNDLSDVTITGATKGDIIAYSTNFADLTVGTNEEILTADSAETTGIKWAAKPPGGNLILIESQTVSSSVSR